MFVSLSVLLVVVEVPHFSLRPSSIYEGGEWLKKLLVVIDYEIAVSPIVPKTTYKYVLRIGGSSYTLQTPFTIK
jgi:hypothetical protein